MNNTYGSDNVFYSERAIERSMLASGHKWVKQPYLFDNWKALFSQRIKEMYNKNVVFV